MRKAHILLSLACVCLVPVTASAQQPVPPGNNKSAADASPESRAPEGLTTPPTQPAGTATGGVSSPATGVAPSGLLQTPGTSNDPNAPSQMAAPSEPPPPNPKEDKADEWQFFYSGYFRANTRTAIGKVREEGSPFERKTQFHSPWLRDDNFTSFAYTPVQEGDWAELFLNVRKGPVTATTSFMTWAYGDAGSSHAPIDSQWGIAQAYLTFNLRPAFLGPKTEVEIRAGAFWDKFGRFAKYDTYMFGRTHQQGEHIRVEFPLNGDWSLRFLHGLGIKPDDADKKMGYTMLQVANAGIKYRNVLDVGLYYLDSWSRDSRYTPANTVTNAGVRNMGADARVNADGFGSLWVATGLLKATQANTLAPAIETMHSFGGQGLTGNYFTTAASNNGSGSMVNVGAVYENSLSGIKRALAGDKTDAAPSLPDLKASVFGLMTRVKRDQTAEQLGQSKSLNQFKFGSELALIPLSWMSLSVRYDRINLDQDNSGNTFSMVSPRITFFSHFLSSELVYLQYSRYFYDDGIRLAAAPPAIPQAHNGATPDRNVIKMQAEIAF